MKPGKLTDMIAAMGGELKSGDAAVEITGVSTDSRTTKPGDLFFALIGENMDGHKFVDTAFEKGAAAVVVSKPVEAKGTVVVVPDTLIALGDLAGWYRDRFELKVVGVTGSVGKTTTKEMIAAVLSQKLRVVCNQGNFNNEIGVPLTVFKLDDGDEVLVQELAMRLPGEIARLAQIVKPDIGVVTNIGLSHIERLGSQDAIGSAKAELLEELTPGGIAVLNGDDPYYEYLSSKSHGEVVSFGLTAGDIRAEDVQIDDLGRASFVIAAGAKRFPVKLAVSGEHYVSSALAATAVGLCFDVSTEQIAEALEGVSSIDKRADVFHADPGWTIIDDTYNASPASVRSALRTLTAMKGTRKIAILGDMKELGDYSVPTHREVGQLAADLGVSLLITIGELGKEIAHGAVEWGFKNLIKEFPTSKDAAAVVRADMKPGDVILVKGSRSMQMETIVEVLR